jgi:CDP-6-deoxy-D-xylo-4-hexulose-3-dehydrase
LKNSSFYQIPKVNKGVWLSMPLICKSHRFEIVTELEKRQIQTRLCLAGNILRQPFYAQLFPDVDPAGFPNTERVFEGGLLVGLHQGLTEEDVDFVCAQLEEIAAPFQ